MQHLLADDDELDRKKVMKAKNRYRANQKEFSKRRLH
jgi:hypothetical protein